MLVDKVTKQTFSCRTEAIRLLGQKEFNKRARRNDLDYIQCRFA